MNPLQRWFHPHLRPAMGTSMWFRSVAMLAFFAFAGGALAQTLTPLHLYMGKPTILDPGLSRYKVRGMDVVEQL